MATQVATPVATPPAVPVGPEGSGGPPPDGAGSQGEDGKKLTPSGLNYRREKMAAGFGEMTTTAEIKKAYAPLIGAVAGRLEAYSLSPGAKLTAEQKDFLALYKQCLAKDDKNFEEILATEARFQSVHTMLELEVLLRSIAIGRDLAMQKKGISPTPIEMEVVLSEYSGWGTRLKKEVDAVLNGILGVFGGDPFRGGKINFTAMAGIDISRLPAEYQSYIQYLQTNINVKSAVNFLKLSAVAFGKLFTGLAVDFRDLNALTPWHRLDLTQDQLVALLPQDFAPNITGDWNNFRLVVLNNLHFFDGPLTAGDKLEKFFKAQRATIAEFTARGLAEINRMPGDKVGKSIQQMEDMKTEITSGVTPARLKKAREEELGDRNEERTRLRQERKEAQTNATEGLDNLEAQIREIDGQRVALTARLTAIGPELVVAQAEQTRIAGIYVGIDAREAAALTGVRIPEDRRIISIPFNKEREAHRAEEAAANTEVNNLTEERKTINTTLTKTYPKLVAKRDEKLARITQIDTVLIPALDVEIERLEHELHEGVVVGDRERMGRFGAAVQALTRYEDVMGDLHDPTKVAEYNLDYFTDTNPDAVRSGLLGGAPASLGYTRIIKLIFDPDYPPKGKEIAPRDFWLRIRELFPEDELANVLIEAFDLTLGLGGGTRLEETFRQMQVERITPIRIKYSFIKIMQRIEQRGLYN